MPPAPPDEALQAAAVAPPVLRDAAARLAAAEPSARVAAAEAARVQEAAAALHAHVAAAAPPPLAAVAEQLLGEPLFDVPAEVRGSDVVQVLQTARNNAVASLQRLRGIRDAAAREADAAATQLRAIDHALRRAAADAAYYKTVEKLARDASARE